MNMNANDFVKWMSGFCEACGEQPSPEQWARLKEVLKSVNAQPGYTPPSSPFPSFRDPYKSVVCGSPSNQSHGVES